MTDRTLILVAERAVAGGLTLCRHDGKVVLVSGAIPGERVRVQVERDTRQVMFARTVDVIEPSAHRRDPSGDPACGGLAYAHVAYAHQLALKAEVIGDTFKRLGKLSLADPVPVEPSTEIGYRMRARLHVRGAAVGFFREGTHELCDAGPSNQLTPATLAAVRALVERFGPSADLCEAVTVAENVSGRERVVHVETTGPGAFPFSPGSPLPEGITGLTTTGRRGVMVLAGDPRVCDRAEDLCPGESRLPASLEWRRTAASFFQSNRFLVGPLLRHVLDASKGERVADLYAGVGLFAVALAAGGASVLAVEGDPIAVADLEANALPWVDRLEVRAAAVEDALGAMSAGVADVVIVDPPRTGLSRETLAGLIRLDAPRVVYVSCDPPTLARDAKALTGAGYTLVSVRAFDMFPNTAHVEVVGVFDRLP